MFCSEVLCIFVTLQRKPEDEQPKLSKKKLRKMNRLSVAELKQVCFVKIQFFVEVKTRFVKVVTKKFVCVHKSPFSKLPLCLRIVLWFISFSAGPQT